MVDDEHEMRYLTSAFLSHAFPSLDVKEASDGRAALALLAKTRFDVIVSDYRMPGMDGFAFLAKAAAYLPMSDCILMTAYADKELQERAKAAGMQFIDKGGDPNSVVEAVEQVLRRRRPVATE
ncbi:MAG TPA: response regulator [Candidatus Thermoplasmatota archaeon]|nr:response regulator [Candidatus Thermoplasmatota archaeon]